MDNPKQQIIPPNHLIYLLHGFHMYTHANTHDSFLPHYVLLRPKIKLICIPGRTPVDKKVD